MEASNTKRIAINSARLIDPSNATDTVGSLFIENGKIVAVGAVGKAPPDFNADITIDGTGQWLTPGFIDLCARTGQPGNDGKGTIASETKAAVRSGITSLVCPPDTKPVIDSGAIITQIIEISAQQGACPVLPLGALTRQLEGEQLSEMHSLHAAGCVGLSNAQVSIHNQKTLLRCLEYAATLDLPVFFSAEDSDLAADGCVHMGATSTRLGLAGIPETAETIAVASTLQLIEQTGVKAHFNQITTAKSVELIAAAQAKGLSVSADVGIRHLLATESQVEGFNSNYHLRPPLRTETDRLALLQGVKDGTINAICSAHTPHEAAAKQAPFPETEPGMSQLDSFLPNCLKLLDTEALSPLELFHRLSTGPATILGLEPASLSVGASANLCLLNPIVTWQLDEAKFFSKGKNSPDLNQQLRGAASLTLEAGKIKWQAS